MQFLRRKTSEVKTGCPFAWTLPVSTNPLVESHFTLVHQMISFTSCHKLRCSPQWIFRRNIGTLSLKKLKVYLKPLNIPFGTFRLTGMLFGLTVVGQSFHCKLDTIYNKLQCTTGSVGEIIIWAEQESGSYHEKQITNSLESQNGNSRN